MIHLLALAVSIGFVDSLNPSTVGPALYLASGKHGRRNVIQFTAAAFAVYFLGGAILTIGPGQLLISLVPHFGATIRHGAETGIGAALVVGAGVLWHRRKRLARREPPGIPKGGRSSAMLGASIMAVELPTAFPYFAVIAAIVAGGLNVGGELALLVIFNLMFVLPLLMVIATLVLGGRHAEAMVRQGRRLLDRYWPQVLAVALALIGVAVAVIGAVGLATPGPG
jgi:cytochrome c biogenesis protein CcdA